MTRFAALVLLPLLLTACATPEEPATGGGTWLRELPEGLAEAAAPGQSLTRVTILPEDSCYWFEYEGRVETTLLPLRTPEGNPICSQARR